MSHYYSAAISAFTASLIVLFLTAALYFVVEPSASHSAAPVERSFTITQEITGAIAFETDPQDITMNGSIDGVTGGSATGTTYTVVSTNNGTGYNLAIRFFDNGSDEAMLGDVTGSDAIRDYDDTGEPTYEFNGSSSALFGYTVSASTSGDLDNSFKSSGGFCNQSSGFNADQCWKGPTGSDFTVYDSSGPALDGSTTSFKFVVRVPNGPDPALSAETYTATATLTATVNP